MNYHKNTGKNFIFWYFLLKVNVSVDTEREIDLKTKVVSIGEEVQGLLDGGVLIMFNPNAPQELKDVAVLHEKQSEEMDVLYEGGELTFGDQTFRIDFVGKDANKNFNELGHLSVYFNNTDEDMGKLPGSVFVSSEKINVPDIKIGQTISFN